MCKEVGTLLFQVGALLYLPQQILITLLPRPAVWEVGRSGEEEEEEEEVGSGEEEGEGEGEKMGKVVVSGEEEGEGEEEMWEVN